MMSLKLKKFVRFLIFICVCLMGIQLFVLCTIAFGFIGTMIAVRVNHGVVTIDVALKGFVYAGVGGYVAQILWIKFYNFMKQAVKKI